MRKLITCYADDGTKQTPDDTGTFTLVADTYFIEFFDDIEDRPVMSVHWKWNAALVATITIEASNDPDASISAATGTGWATTGATTVSPAASASEVIAHYADYAALRMRAKVVVGTGGTLKGIEHSKLRGAR